MNSEFGFDLVLRRKSFERGFDGYGATKVQLDEGSWLVLSGVTRAE